MAAPKMNRYNSKMTVEERVDQFNMILKKCLDDELDYLCLQEAYYAEGIAKSTFNDLCSKHKELDSIKEDMKAAINIRVNRLAIKNQGNATACIWRMKQLGEVDQQTVNQNIKHSEPTEVIFRNYDDDRT